MFASLIFPQAQSRFRRFEKSWSLFALFMMQGCFGDGFSYSHVTGQVVHDGQPMPNIQVTFYPDPDIKSPGMTARGTTNDEGIFELKTTKSNKKGAALGTYLVTLGYGAPRESVAESEQPQKAPQKLPSGVKLPEGVVLPEKPATVRRPSQDSKLSSKSQSPFETPFRGVAVDSKRQHYQFDLKTETWKQVDP